MSFHKKRAPFATELYNVTISAPYDIDEIPHVDTSA